MRIRRLGLLAPLAALSLAGCGLNSVPTADENVKAKWGDLQADYQRRADLIPNLVATVKGYAQQEKSVLIEVTQARASANSVKLSADDLSDPAKVQAFKNAQSAAEQRDHPAAATARSLSGPEIEPELPGAPGSAGGHREPDQRLAPRL